MKNRDERKAYVRDWDEREDQINRLRTFRDVMIKTREKVLREMALSRTSTSSIGVSMEPLFPNYETFKAEYITRMKRALSDQGIQVEEEDIIEPTKII